MDIQSGSHHLRVDTTESELRFDITYITCNNLLCPCHLLCIALILHFLGIFWIYPVLL
jgi:hypothetical protein